MTNSVLQAIAIGTLCVLYAIKGAIPIFGWAAWVAAKVF